MLHEPPTPHPPSRDEMFCEDFFQFWGSSSFQFMNFYVASFTNAVVSIKLLATCLSTVTLVFTVRGGQETLEKEV